MRGRSVEAIAPRLYTTLMQSGRALSRREFQSCFAAPMRDVTVDAEPLVDIWSYVDRLDRDMLDLPELGDVAHVYRDALDRFDQVLIATVRRNAWLVIVVNRAARVVLGRHLLDLGEEYDVCDLARLPVG